ncbi:MAG: sulfatase [Kiritimatiellae bacterium]|nr:sulfatase [Kiritimatiellia bacterium]
MSAATQPNIVLVAVESLRADHVGCYGYRRATSPAMDALAAEGVRFDQAISAASWTTPAVMSMFTSLPPSLHQTVSSSTMLPEGLTTLATELKNGGYQTAAIIVNPCASSKYGFNRGFDVFDDSSIQLAAGLGDLDLNNNSVSDMVTQYAVKWLKSCRRPSLPFFLYVFYFDPHYDYMPPSPYDGMFTDPDYYGDQDGSKIVRLAGKPLAKADKEQIIGLYDGEIRFTDDQIKVLIDTLRDMNLLTDTLLVITGDHGEEFWDHDRMMHAHTLYDELLRVPLIIHWPKEIKPKQVVAEQVSLVDLMPTLLDMAGLPIPGQCRGQSLVSLFMSSSRRTFTERPVFAETESRTALKCIRTSSQILIEHVKDKTFEAYDLENDPFERDDLALMPQYTEFQPLLTAYEDWKKQNAEFNATNRPAQTIKIDPQLMKQLKSLGYAH